MRLEDLKDMEGLNLNDYDLNEEEQSVMLEILEELREEGDSETLRSLWKADYEEIPVDIDTFIEDEDYLGQSTDGGELLYPFWREQLREIFDEDNDYYEVAISGAIGIGKTTVAVISLAYILYRLLCLKDPQSYYDLTPGSKIGVAFFNVTLDQSYGVAYSRLQEYVKNSPWFRRHGEIRGRKKEVYIPNKNIEFVVGSQKSHGLGRDIFCMSGDTKVLTKEHGMKSLHELSKTGESITVASYNEKSGEIEWAPTQRVELLGTDVDLYEVELESGIRYKVTKDHEFMVEDEEGNTQFKSMEELEVGDDIKHVVINKEQINHAI